LLLPNQLAWGIAIDTILVTHTLFLIFKTGLNLSLSSFQRQGKA
jgi:hypothetical protein